MNEHLIYMLSKVQYGRISKSRFDSKVDEIIEKLRKNFPHVQPIRQQNSFRFELKFESQPEIINEPDPMLILLSANKTWAIRITPSFVILHTKKYEGFDDFLNKMLMVVKEVNESFEISHISFMGMRFLNNFEYDPNTKFTDSFKRMDFLQPELNEWMRMGSNLSARYPILPNMININSGVMINAPKYLPDLIDLAVDLDDVTKINERPIAYLDIDSFFATEHDLKEFSMPFIAEKLKDLRTNANQAFYEIIVDEKTGG
ncbi:TIGR04255 family protein [Nissabacter archeti]|uniref:TIGR04255 family protein n=1 Tax=Nissabacter archeti TaxID=1917880 RepID=UPI000934AE0A|nr:TIGR04255 family protein [Nissabacter archeti]